MMKRILFVANNNALNNSFGAEQRSHLLLHALIANGFEVDLAYIGTKIETYKPVIEGVNIVYWNNGTQWRISRKNKTLRLLTFRMFPISEELELIIDNLEQQNNYDYIVCRYIQFASIAGLYKYADKLILDIDDLPSQSFITHLKKSNPLKNLYRKRIYQSMEHETKRWICKCKASLLPNKEQSEKYGGKYFPNIPAIYSNTTSFLANCKNVLFIGRLDFDPNYLGIDAFINNCWDKIVEHVPDAKLLIAGKGLNAEYKQSWLQHPNIKVLGFVNDLLDFYSKGNIVISPINSGAGTNIKVIEALSLGKACVLSQFSTKGFNEVLVENYNCLIYNNYQDCISKVIRLLQDDSFTEKIAYNAFISTKGKYSQDRLNNILNSVL